MAKLDIRLLGEFAILCDDAPLTTINTPRLQCLLAYLLLHRNAPLARQHLAYLHWPDSSEPQARSNLRNLLYSLMQALPESERFIQADNQTVQWRPDAPCTLDVELFLTALTTARSAADLERALELHRGPLLPSCYDDWIAPEREQLEQKLDDVLQRFVNQWEKEGAYRDAITYARHLVRRDPLREDVCRQLMGFYALSGDRAGVHHTYKKCQDILWQELQVEPSRETRQAYEKYIKMEVSAVKPKVAPEIASGAAVAKETKSIDHVTFADWKRISSLLSDIIQHPFTSVPLTLAIMALIYLMLYQSRLGGGDLALAVLVIASLAAAVSFGWLFAIRALVPSSHVFRHFLRWIRGILRRAWYSHVLFRRAVVDANNAFAGDRSAILRALVLVLGSGVVSAWLTPPSKPMTDIFVNASAGTLVGASVWYVVLFIGNVVNILTTKVQLKVVAYNGDANRKKCGIQIINGTISKITHLRVERGTSANWVWRDGRKIPVATIDDDNRRFDKAKGFPEPNTLYLDDDVFIYFAEVREHKPILLLEREYPYDAIDLNWTEAPPASFDSVTLEFDFEIKGNIDEKTFPPHNYTAQIYFQRRTMKQIFDAGWGGWRDHRKGDPPPKVESYIEIRVLVHKEEENEQKANSAQ